jgi:ferritin-like metal-binding protein YciE
MEANLMKLETLRDLLVEELKDMYDAEQQLVEALPEMKKAASSPQLKTAFDDHLKQTQQHVTRLEHVFEMMDQRPSRKPCKAMKGLVKEGQEMIEEKADKDVKDAGLIAAAQRVEHYEIAAYGTAMAYCKQIGNDEALRLLSQTLEEEKMTDQLLTQLAESSINIKASS